MFLRQEINILQEYRSRYNWNVFPYLYHHFVLCVSLLLIEQLATQKDSNAISKYKFNNLIYQGFYLKMTWKHSQGPVFIFKLWKTHLVCFASCCGLHSQLSLELSWNSFPKAKNCIYFQRPAVNIASKG